VNQQKVKGEHGVNQQGKRGAWCEPAKPSKVKERAWWTSKVKEGSE
jgi:hypothetical protein